MELIIILSLYAVFAYICYCRDKSKLLQLKALYEFAKHDPYWPQDRARMSQKDVERLKKMGIDVDAPPNPYLRGRKPLPPDYLTCPTPTLFNITVRSQQLMGKLFAALNQFQGQSVPVQQESPEH